ncbi:hypothetical protein DFJ74DRAFT_706226 [Hyaloraphidium curvatum]|nr:hypothetical protein DFJ74DRAFT_706226 [Hyaloraphidium curvatum]
MSRAPPPKSLRGVRDSRNPQSAQREMHLSAAADLLSGLLPPNTDLGPDASFDEVEGLVRGLTRSTGELHELELENAAARHELRHYPHAGAGPIAESARHAEELLDHLSNLNDQLPAAAKKMRNKPKGDFIALEPEVHADFYNLCKGIFNDLAWADRDIEAFRHVRILGQARPAELVNRYSKDPVKRLAAIIDRGRNKVAAAESKLGPLSF